MKRIFITETISRLAHDYACGLFSTRYASFEKPIERLKRLKKQLELASNSAKYQSYINYVQFVINNYEEILQLKPADFVLWSQKKELSSVNCNDNIIIKSNNGRTTTKKFYELVVYAMRYKDVREQEFLPYIQLLGIKSCVYCNAQYAVTTVGKPPISTYQLDHYFPKSKYPFLCTSFFNLQPSCASCNQAKGSKAIKFNLYTDNKNYIYPFQFQLDKTGVSKYMLTHKRDELSVSLDVTSTSNSSLSLLKNHKDIFKIDTLYECHKDTIEEIVWKSRIYNKSYIKQLKDMFSELFPSGPEFFNRFILGFPSKRSEIHKRPLTMLAQDVAKALGLL